jgi:hypothetical protein
MKCQTIIIDIIHESRDFQLKKRQMHSLLVATVMTFDKSTMIKYELLEIAVFNQNHNVYPLRRMTRLVPLALIGTIESTR